MTNFTNYGVYYSSYVRTIKPTPTTQSYIDVLKSLYPDSHDINAQVYNAVLGAIGSVLDQYDPFKIGLPQEFSVTTANGNALDRHGADWGVIRRTDENDDTYRARILSTLPIYANGASDWGITATVMPFTNESPILNDYSQYGWEWSISAFGDGKSAFCDLNGLFTIVIYVQNSNNLSYSHYDMEYAVRRAKPARSRAILHHNGPDTSTLNEASDAIITVV